MNLTAKSRYALKIMMDLAASDLETIQQRHKIAERQRISVDFMDHVMAKLRASGLVTSTRGRNGGFHLQRSPKDINLWDIISSVEDHIYPVRCIDEQCHLEHDCISHDVWNEVVQSIRNEMSQKSLDEMVTRWKNKQVSPLSSDNPAETSTNL